MPGNPALRALASSAFSLPKLRDGQLAGMAALAQGRDVLALMPTVLVQRADAASAPFPVQSPVTHKKWGAGLVMRCKDDVITVLFEREGYKTLSRRLSWRANC